MVIHSHLEGTGHVPKRHKWGISFNKKAGRVIRPAFFVNGFRINDPNSNHQGLRWESLA